ncbi:MAG TPA: GNAT family N-acetyltransferase [Steroidobacteraceae bacterium]|nr:GNAT family N-acetyltransferase [Steroidobacteraceae bacterium]
MAIRILEADSSTLGIVRTLFTEYATWLDMDVEYRQFERELADLPGAYAPPRGALLLAWVDDAVAGCVAMRPLEAKVCEMKRLWVRTDFRGQGVGPALARAIMRHACGCGYAQMRLDTLHHMKAAQAIYTALGFKPIAPYNSNPESETLFMEAQLSDLARQGGEEP